MRHKKPGEPLRQKGFISQNELDKGLQKQSELNQEKIGGVLLEESKIKSSEIKRPLKAWRPL